MNQLITFNDILLQPQFSTIESRREIDISSGGLNLPILSSNMDTVTDLHTCKIMNNWEGLGILPRKTIIDRSQYASWKWEDLYFQKIPCGISLGIDKEERKQYKEQLDFIENSKDSFVKWIVLDAAHGSCSQMEYAINDLLELNDTIDIMIGNISCGENIKEIVRSIQNPRSIIFERVKAFKVGIGSGAVCSTRSITGHGYPQLSAIQSVKEVISEYWAEDTLIVSDGGCRTIGDVVKALAFGADLVMLGYLLAKATDSPGKGYYSGLSAKNHNHGRTDEGVSVTLKNRELELYQILYDIEWGIRSALSYSGAKNMKEFREKVVYNLVSQGTISENSVIQG